MARAHRNPTPRILVATFRVGGRPVTIRPELAETIPAHADMLRYDLGFHAPHDPSLVVFPWFKHKRDGEYPRDLTTRRWESFAIRLALKEDEEEVFSILRDHPIGDWISYQHPPTDYSLQPVTLTDWLKAHPDVKIDTWKSLPIVAESRYWAVTG